MVRLYFIVLIVLAIDQISKIYVVHYLNLQEKLAIDVLSPVINFRMAWNTGINFGFFGSGGNGSRMILIFVSILICLMLHWWVRSSKDNVIKVLVALIIGGAAGNTIDRVIFGAVADFLNMSCCGIRNPFSFNLADVAIFFGAIGLIFYNKKEVVDEL